MCNRQQYGVFDELERVAPMTVVVASLLSQTHNLMVMLLELRPTVIGGSLTDGRKLCGLRVTFPF